MTRYRVEVEAVFDLEVTANSEREAREQARTLIRENWHPLQTMPARYVDVVVAETIEGGLGGGGVTPT